MRNIVKTFEDWSSQGFGYQYKPYNDKIEEDVKGILVEVMDMGIDIQISWIGNSGFMLDFTKEDSFDTELLIEYVLTIEDYIIDKYGNKYTFEYKLAPIENDKPYLRPKKLEGGIIVKSVTMGVMNRNN